MIKLKSDDIFAHHDEECRSPSTKAMHSFKNVYHFKMIIIIVV
jgi:hypothetical protein